MATKLPYGDWLNLMAEATGFEREAFKALSATDRRELMAAASGMTWDAFAQLPDATAQVEAIRKHSGGEVKIRQDNRAEGGGKKSQFKAKAEDGEKAEGKAEAQTQADAQGEGEGEGSGESEGKGEGEGQAQADDPSVTLKGLSTFLEPFVEALVKKRLDEMELPKGSSQRIEIKLPEGEARQIEGHVHPKFEQVLKLAALGLPVMLVGPAGTGKTTIAGQVAAALDRPFGAVSCTAGMSEGELVGKLLPDETGAFHYRESQFVRLYENGGIFLLDEVDAADANVILKMNQSIGQVGGGGRWFNDLRSKAPEVRQHKDFVLVAAANTFGTGAGAQYVGRNQLDAATLDRFAVVEIDYDTAYEKAVGDEAICTWLWDVRKKAQAAKLRRVVSTRSIQRCTMMKQAGMSQKDIETLFFAPWSVDEKAKVAA